MPDYLLSLANVPFAKKLFRQLKIPVPLPEVLRRASGPFAEQPLKAKKLSYYDASARDDSHDTDSIVASILENLGAKPDKVDKGSVSGATEISPDARLDAVVVDFPRLSTLQQLNEVYAFIHPRLSQLKTSGRIVIVAPPPEMARTAEAAAARQGLTGFVKSLAKELGKRGTTATVLFVADDARTEALLSAPLGFLLSERSAFISGQTLTIERPKAAGSARIAGSLGGKVALVTGAAHGIGAQIAMQLAYEGAKVIGIDRPEEIDALSVVMTAAQGISLPFDLSKPEAPTEIAAAVKKATGGTDIVVHNAGITRDRTLARMKREHWDAVLGINLAAAVRMTEALSGDSGLLRRDGRLIFLSSVGGIAGNAGQTNYAAAKAGLIGYVRALAPLVAENGVTVNAVAPGFIETRMTEAMPVAIREVARRFNALNQAGRPSDIADAVSFLASPGAAGISGQVLRVCGLNFIGA